MKILARILVSVMIILVLDFITGFIIIPETFHSFRTSHYYYHHGLLPNQNTMGAWGSLVYNVNTNSLGFIDSAVYKVPDSTEKERLLIIGDSHSEGVGVPYLKTFSGILASKLNSRNVEVMNASCISYSPKIEYLKMKYIIENEGIIPDHIFLLIDISDMQNELVYEGFNPHEDFSWAKDVKQRIGTFLNRHFSIYYLVNSILKTAKQNEFMEKAKLFSESDADYGAINTLQLYSDFFSHFDDNTLLSNPQFHGVGEWYYNENFLPLADRGIDLGQSHILKLKELCDKYSIDLTISVHPWQMQIYKGQTEDYYVTRWKEFAAKNQISFINLFPLFVNEQNPVLVKDLYYIKGDNHWNDFGHSLVAATLLQYFNDQFSNTLTNE